MKQLELVELLRDYQTAVATTLRCPVPGQPAALIDPFMAALTAVDTTLAPLSPQMQPVCRCWDSVLQAMAEGEQTAVFAPLLQQLTPYLHWRQTYPPSEQIAHFLQNYAYAELIGPYGLATSHQLRTGLLLLGPHTQYLPHAHPAEELYYVLAGQANWLHHAPPWQRQPPGTLIYHAGQVVHATQTEAEPLLALYLWRNHLTTDATIDFI